MSDYSAQVLERAAKACELNGWPDTAAEVRVIAALRQQASPVAVTMLRLEDAWRAGIEHRNDGGFRDDAMLAALRSLGFVEGVHFEVVS